MVPVNLVLIIFLSLILIKATEILLVNLKLIFIKAKIGVFFLSGLVGALATSLPELFVGLSSVFRGEPNLSLGNIIGANIATLSLVIGGAALIGGAVAVKGEFLYRDVFYAFLAGAAPMVLLFDKNLSRIDGLVLLLLYLFYQMTVFSQKKTGTDDRQIITKLLHRLKTKDVQKEIGWIFLSMALVIFSADAIVQLATGIAVALSLPILLIGLILVAIATTLPELIFELESIQKQQPEMVFGTLLGTIVVHSTLIIGLVALISPLNIKGLEEYFLATMAFVVIFGAFYYFVHTKRRLERWEGAVLVLFYLAFVIAEFI